MNQADQRPWLASCTCHGRVLALCVCLAAPLSEAFPIKPVTIVVPYTAGGFPDLLARNIAQPLSGALGQPVRIDNRPGASGSVGALWVIRAEPDGYTLLQADSALLTIRPYMAKSAANLARDLVPVYGIAENTMLLAVNARTPVNSVPELIEHARRSKTPLSYSSTGPGGQFHLTMERFKALAGIALLHVPYKGGPQSVAAAVAGEVALVIGGNNAAAQVAGGKLRALAVTGRTRLGSLPEVPALNEYFPGFEASTWQGLFVRFDTPKEIVARLEADIAQVLTSTELRRQLTRGSDVQLLNLPAKAFADRIREDGKRHRATIEQLGLASE